MKKSVIRRDSMVFFRSIYDATKDLKPVIRERFLTALLAYSFDGIEPVELGPLEKMMFDLVRPTVDRSIARYERCVANGKKGGRPKKNHKENQEKKPARNP